MNTRYYMVIIKGKIKTSEIMSCYFKIKILEIRKCFSRLREAFFHII